MRVIIVKKSGKEVDLGPNWREALHLPPKGQDENTVAKTPKRPRARKKTK